MNIESDDTEEYGSLAVALERGEFWFKPKKLELDMKYRESPTAKPSIEEAPKLYLKALPPYLRYVFLEKKMTFSKNHCMEFKYGASGVCGRGVKEVQMSH